MSVTNSCQNNEKEKPIEKDDSLDLASNGISFTPSNSQQAFVSKNKYSSSKDKLDDDNYRGKSSGIPDIRSQKDWDKFLNSPVIQKYLKHNVNGASIIYS